MVGVSLDCCNRAWCIEGVLAFLCGFVRFGFDDKIDGDGRWL